MAKSTKQRSVYSVQLETPIVRDTMRDLVKWVRRRLQNHKGKGLEHHTLCSEACDRYNLWEDDRFPLRLSVVVEAVMKGSI